MGWPRGLALGGGETAAAVLKPFCVATGETDLSWQPIR